MPAALGDSYRGEGKRRLWQVRTTETQPCKPLQAPASQLAPPNVGEVRKPLLALKPAAWALRAL